MKIKNPTDTVIRALKKIYRATMKDNNHRYALKAIELIAKVCGIFSTEKSPKPNKKIAARESKNEQEIETTCMNTNTLKIMYQNLTTEIGTLKDKASQDASQNRNQSNSVNTIDHS